MERMLTAVFRDQHEAIEAYNWLRKHGYSLEEINVLLSEQHKQRFHDIQHDDKVELKADYPVSAGRWGFMGATVGAIVVGVFGGSMSLALSELGLLGVTPIPAVIAGLIAGAMFGGLAGGLIGYGFPDFIAKKYEPFLHDGGIALGVKPHTSLEERIIKSEFEKLHGEKILMG